MIANVVIGMIISLCEGDNSLYYVQDYKRSCMQYYVNCVVDNGSDVKAVNECEDKADEQRVK